MKIIIQYVSSAKVETGQEVVGQIKGGYLILVGISRKDGYDEVKKMADMALSLRIIPDNLGRMNKSIKDIKGEILTVSQFTLLADVSRGRRPSYLDAGDSEEAQKLYLQFIDELKKSGLRIEQGKFGKLMRVSLVNNGPITIILES